MTKARVLRHRQNDAGVTLLELLVALALMALLAGIAFTLIAASERSGTRANRVAQQVEMLLGREELRTVLERAVVIPDQTGMNFGLAGITPRLQAWAILDDGTFWPGLPVKVSLGLQEGAEKPWVELVMEGEAELDRAPIERRHRLSVPGGRAELSYFGASKPGSYPEWQDKWPADAPLPLLVRLVVRDEQGTAAPLILRPGKFFLQSEMSLSSLVPPATPSRP